MQRRAFIHLSAYIAAVLAMPAVIGCNNKKMDMEAQPFFFSHLVDVKTIMEIGKAYRKANPEQDDKNKLAGLLLLANPAGASSDNMNIRYALDNKVKEDFKAGEITVIKGWVLSITETRQCALFSILQS